MILLVSSSSQFCIGGMSIPGKDIARGSGTKGVMGKRVWEWKGRFAVIGNHKDRVESGGIVGIGECGRFVISRRRHCFDL